MKHWLFHIAFLSLFTFAGWSADAQTNFEAKVNRSTVGKNEQFTLTFSINANASNFRAPDLSDFYVLSGPNQSRSTQIINYEMSVNTSFSYILRPKSTGTFRIGAASISADGNTYTSDPVSIQVTDQPTRSGDPNDPYALAARNAFVRVISSRTSVYQGEPFVASYKLYLKTDIGQPQILSEPDFTGFYKQNVDLGNIRTQQENYEGTTYTTGIARQMVLIPQRSGSIRPGIIEMQLPTQVPTGRRDIFGRMYSRTVNQTSTDNFPTIRVKELPEAGKPSGFNGAVGQYKMEVGISRNALNADESVSLKIRISGDGNIKLIEAPEPEIPTAFEAYDPKYQESISVDGSGMHGSKTYEYLLIPRYGGTYKIPPVSFSYFDPRTERYQTITSDELEVKVTGGMPQPAVNGVTATGEKEQVDFISKDILFIKTDPGRFTKKGQSFVNSTGFYGALGAIGLAFAGMLGFFIFSNTRSTDQSRIRSEKASKAAYKRLSQAKKEMAKNDNEAFYLELSSALWGYFSDKFTIPRSELTKDTIRERLVTKNVDLQAIDQLSELMNRAEMARFTSLKAASPKEDYEQAARLITQIEKQL